MVNKELRDKFGVYAKTWLILAGRPEISPNPNMADFGVNKERLEKIIEKNAEQAIKSLLRILEKTSIAITPTQISQKDFIDILGPKKSDYVRDIKEVSYNFGAGSFRINDYQPEGTGKTADRRYKVSISLLDECNLRFDLPESGRFKIRDRTYELEIYCPEKSRKILSIRNIPLAAIPEVLFFLLYEPRSFVDIKDAGNRKLEPV